MTLTQEEAHRLFECKDGVLFWKEKPRCSRRTDKSLEAGTVTTGGYKKVGVQQKRYYVHQIVFLMTHGHIPVLIDHIDGNTANNRVQNLRASDKSKNACNSKLRKDNTSGHRGVIWSKACKKWTAKIQVRNKQMHIGVFDDYELACLAADEARNLYHGAYAKV